MSRDDGGLALPTLAVGISGGMVASLFCFCWAASLPAGALAVRWAHQRSGGIRSSTVLSIGLGTGTVLGLVVASLGTALFIASLDPGAMTEAAAMTESLLGESSDVSLGMAALGHAGLAFFTNLTLGVLGALLGGASLPQAGASEVEAREPGYRFEPPEGWTPSAKDPFEEEEKRRKAMSHEAFHSAWNSAASGGIPVPARRQSPPPEDPTEKVDPGTVAKVAAEPPGTSDDENSTLD